MATALDGVRDQQQRSHHHGQQEQEPSQVLGHGRSGPCSLVQETAGMLVSAFVCVRDVCSCRRIEDIEKK